MQVVISPQPQGPKAYRFPSRKITHTSVCLTHMCVIWCPSIRPGPFFPLYSICKHLTSVNITSGGSCGRAQTHIATLPPGTETGESIQICLMNAGFLPKPVISLTGIRCCQLCAGELTFPCPVRVAVAVPYSVGLPTYAHVQVWKGLASV